MSPAEPDPDPGTDAEPPQHASQRVLKSDRDPYRAVFDHSPLPMLLCDVGTLQVLAANERGARLHGTSPEQLVGVSLFELRRVSDLTGVMLKRAAGREIALGFGYHTRKDGSMFPVQLSVHPSELGGRPAWLCVMKSLEDALAPREDAQQRRVLESIGRLSGGAAHDLNNLLSVILSFSSLAASQLSESSPVQADLAEIRGAAERASALTKQLSSLSRKGPRAPKPTSLNEVVLNVEKLLRRLVDEQLELKLELSPILDRVLVDPAQVERLLVQLVSEAREAAAPGSCLVIETRNVDLDVSHGQPRHVMLQVIDSGSSLSPEVAARVFEPLSSAMPAERGSGLTSLVGAAGTAWLESEAGAGTRFVACFPSIIGPTSEVPSERRITRDQTVLVVQDNPHLRKTLKTYFAREGYRVLDADSSLEAVRLSEQHPDIDLLLTDYSLADGAGAQLAQALRQQQPQLRVLIATSHPEQRATIREDGRTLSISKPFDLQQFGQLVQRLLDQA